MNDVKARRGSESVALRTQYSVLRTQYPGRGAVYPLLGCAAFLFIAILTQAAYAEVLSFEITERTPFADGQSFGDVGPYERIVGKVFYAIHPHKRQNKPIVDLQHAPTDALSKVHFASDLYILAPKDLSKGNQSLLYDVNNRGNKLALRFFNDAPGGNNPKSAGNGFLMRHGFTVVWSGWDGELLPGNLRQRLTAPFAGNVDKPITGKVRYEVCVNDGDKTKVDINGGGHGCYTPIATGLNNATLTWRLRPGDPRIPIPREQFRIHTVTPANSAGQLAHMQLELPAGFRQGYLYELIYEAQDPLVHGVCFAAVRDLISSLKQGTGSANPLLIKEKPVVKYAHGFGVSQSGRFLREMLYAGFNEDENGKQVFDGLIPHVAGGGLGSFNHRFAQPTAFVTQHQNHDWHSDRFPFAYETQTDPLSGQKEGILERAAAADVVPKILHTQSSSEYWSRAGSLPHTDPLGKQDATPPKNVRIYTFGGTQHGPASYPPGRGIGQTMSNHADYKPHLRALLVALDQWCRNDKPAPPSVYPKICDKTLVEFHQPSTKFPSIPGVRYPEVIQQPSFLELGKQWTNERIIDQIPPRKISPYKVLVPKCGTDGNELGCLLPPEVAVPLATFTSWNLRRADAGAENDLVGLNGSYIPLPLSKADRLTAADPRPSIEERYKTIKQYLAQLKGYCKERVASGYLLDEDVSRIVERQEERAKPLFKKLSEAESD